MSRSKSDNVRTMLSPNKLFPEKSLAASCLPGVGCCLPEVGCCLPGVGCCWRTGRWQGRGRPSWRRLGHAGRSRRPYLWGTRQLPAAGPHHCRSAGQPHTAGCSLHCNKHTVNSRYLKFQGTVEHSLKYINILSYPNLRIVWVNL